MLLTHAGIRSSLLLLSLSSITAVAAPIRIDFGMNSGRNDTATPGWHEWQVPFPGAEGWGRFALGGRGLSGWIAADG